MGVMICSTEPAGMHGPDATKQRRSAALLGSIGDQAVAATSGVGAATSAGAFLATLLRAGALVLAAVLALGEGLAGVGFRPLDMPLTLLRVLSDRDFTVATALSE